MDGQLPADEISSRLEDLAGLADELMAERAAERIGERAEILIDEILGEGHYLGRAAHQAPEVDGATEVRSDRPLSPGDLVSAVFADSEGVDLTADADGGATRSAADSR